MVPAVRGPAESPARQSPSWITGDRQVLIENHRGVTQYSRRGNKSFE